MCACVWGKGKHAFSEREEILGSLFFFSPITGVGAKPRAREREKEREKITKILFDQGMKRETASGEH